MSDIENGISSSGVETAAFLAENLGTTLADLSMFSS
jgi:hypothetical protein